MATATRQRTTKHDLATLEGDFRTHVSDALGTRKCLRTSHEHLSRAVGSALQFINAAHDAAPELFYRADGSVDEFGSFGMLRD